jgi:hypothetical protein
VRAALISIVGQSRGTASKAQGCIAGKSLAHRQLAFALAAGAEQIVILGDAGSRETIELRHAAERAGAKVLTITDGHGLLGVIGAADQLLVLAPGLLPEAPMVLETLGKGSSLLVLPASEGIPAGFERIDAGRAWAGVLVIQGGLVERLTELPSECDPAPALLRIALQAQVAERRLPETVLADGSWVMIKARDDMADAERTWLQRNLPEPPRNRPARWLGALLLRLAAPKLLEKTRAGALIAALVAVLLVAGIASSAMGWVITGFALVAFGAVGSELAAGLSRLAQAPFGRGGRTPLPVGALGALVDLSLGTSAVLAIGQDWLHRLFPPLVLMALLLVLRPEERSGSAALAGDRLLLALALMLAAALGVTEPAVMTLALGLIVLEAAKTLEGRG